MADTPLAVARSLAERIGAAAEDMERDRQLADWLVAELKSAGVLRLLVPRALGGGELDAPEFLNVVEAYGNADASTGWCVTQGAIIATTSAWLDPQAARVIWDDPDASVANGPPGDCVVRREAGVSRLSGRWRFSSGGRHATWLTGAARREDDNKWLMPFFPVSQATMIDTWNVRGLRATGSFDFEVNDLEVPEEFISDQSQPPRHDGALYRIPVGLLFAVSFASVALGNARAALDYTFAVAEGKVPKYSSKSLREEPSAQRMVGEAEIRWRAARAFLHATVNEVWEALASQDRITADQRVQLRMAGTHVIREAAQVTDLAYTVCGTTGIYDDTMLQRRFQDMHVITQHIQGRMSFYDYVGRHLLGYPFEPGPLN